MWKKLYYMDYVLFILYLIFSGIGVVMVYLLSLYVVV